MSRAKVVAIKKQPATEPFQLNGVQKSGIAGVEEQIERTYALISGAQSWLKNWPEDVQLHKEDFVTVHALLNMAQDEIGDLTFLYRIRDGKYRD
jgi:hypothetical protein